MITAVVAELLLSSFRSAFKLHIRLGGRAL